METIYSIWTWDPKTRRNSVQWDFCPHPFEQFFIPHNATKLIIGSFPTAEHNYEKTFKFFYGGEKNRFWEVMQTVLKEKFTHFSGEEAVKERRELFKKKGIGITDMLTKCLRRNKKSQDIDLYPIGLLDLFSLLREHPNITRLILTSRTELIGALGLLKLYFLQQGRFIGDLTSDSDKILRTCFQIDDRKIEVCVPYSTSSSNSHIDNESLNKMYYKCLIE